MLVPTKKLHEIADVFSGYAFKSKDLCKEGIPVVKIKNVNNKVVSPECDQFLPESLITERLKKYLLKKEDILVAMTGQGSLGRIGKMTNQKEQYIVNQRVGIVRAKEGNNSVADYLFSVLALNEYEKQLYSLGAGAGQPNVSAVDIGNLDIPYPEENIRDWIASARCNYDNLIENNNRRIAILEEMAQSLYREWFVNFRYPGHADDTKNSESADENYDAVTGENSNKPTLIDSPLGPIPEGWEVKTLLELIDFKRNTIKKGNVSPKTPYMGLEHFPRKSIALANWDEVDEIGSNKLAFERGDILFGKIRPNFHKVGVAQIDGLCSSDTFVLSPIDSDHHALISMVTFSDEFVAQAVQTSQGSKMPRASWDVLKEFPVYIPSQEILDKFNTVVNPAIEQVRVLSLKNRNLKKQRDMLLPKLISGQIELKD